MEIFCTLHYVCTYIQGIPQIYKLLKTKSSNDYSLWQISLSLTAMVCWTLYVFTEKAKFATIVYIGTILDLGLMLFIDILILIFYKFKKRNSNIF